MKKYKLQGREYEVLEVISSPEILNGMAIPLIDMPMMSDERWQELAIESAVKHYIQRHGFPPVDKETAIREERRIINEFLTTEGIRYNVIEKVSENVQAN